MQIEYLEMLLSKYLSHTQVYENGQVIEIKAEIKRIDGLKLLMYANDHNPPHFHVEAPSEGIRAKFTLEDCRLIGGEIDRKNRRKIESFFNKHKDLFWSFWNTKSK